MSESYSFLKEIKSPTTQRAFIYDAIRDGLIECSDEALQAELRLSEEDKAILTRKRVEEAELTASTKKKKKEKDNGRRGQASPEIWLSDKARQDIGGFFDAAVEELKNTSKVILDIEDRALKDAHINSLEADAVDIVQRDAA